jgi:type IV pilus assembly protein PilB
MVLLTGPTGSGKTTTLAAMVDHLNQVTRNIMTIEEPVEIRIPGVQQVDVNRAVSLSFAAAVRNFLRMDPDVIMVGEIRDFETAEAATQAAATGHLVLSTLHTNDAAFTIERLRMMGIEPFLIGNNLSLVVAQRLARRICPSCPPVKDEVSDDVLRSLGVKPNEMKKFVARRGSGVKQRRKCLYCRGAGYKGRIPIYEMLVFTDEIKRAIFDGLTTDQVRDIARKQGMLTLREAGIERIRNGETTVEEVLRVTTE